MLILSGADETDQLELSYTAGGDAKWYSHSGNYFVVSHIFTCDPTITFLKL